MIAIVDYGVGNLYSLRCSLLSLGIEAEVTGDAKGIKSAERMILPGVGAFGDAMERLNGSGLTEVVKTEAKKKPLLGICLGMQLLFEKSYEFGEHAGLALIPGAILPLENDLRNAGYHYKIPQMGWNSLVLRQRGCPILKYTEEGDAMYYVHSFYARCGESTAAVSDYGVSVSGVVQNGLVFGTQFHPEKSGDRGLRILKAFSEV